MKVIGLDPGFANCGRAVVEFVAGSLPRVLLADTVVTLPEEETEDRLQNLAVALLELGEADLYITEEQHGVREGKRLAGQRRNAKSDYVLEVVGMFRLVSAAYGKRVQVLTPGSIRSALSLPREADKKAIEARVGELCAGLGDCLDKLKNKHREHAADAVAIALAGYKNVVKR